MSSNGISGISNVSNDTLQTRYQKSIKQYNKLIQINRQLKDTNTSNQSKLIQMSKQLSTLNQHISALDNQNNIMDQKYMQLSSNYQQLQMYSKKIEEQLRNDRLKLQEYDQQYNLQIQKYNHIVKQYQQLQNLYQQTIKIIQTRQQQIKHLQSIKQQYQQSIKKIIEQKKYVQDNNKQMKIMMKAENIQELQLQLSSAQNNIERLIKECNQLKSKEISSQLIKQKQKMQKYITLNTKIEDHKQDYTINHLLHQYKTRIRNLEAQNKNLVMKSKQAKNKIKDIQKQYQNKILNLQKLTQKQQKQIMTIIQTYDTQLLKIHNQNKKLKDMYYQLNRKHKKDNDHILVNQLKASYQLIMHENQSLKKINHSLKIERENHIRQNYKKQTDKFISNISRAESFQVMKRPQIQQSHVQIKYSQIQSDFYDNHDTIHQGPQRTQQNIKMAKNKVPINIHVTNNPDDKNNFKFIQSVNIINGFNVSLNQKR